MLHELWSQNTSSHTRKQKTLNALCCTEELVLRFKKETLFFEINKTKIPPGLILPKEIMKNDTKKD
jgi:hypothetical protein